MLIPGNPVPALKIETVGGGSFDLEDDKGKNGTLVIQYRGLHCPICIRQMGEVEAALDDFTALGVEVIMLSTDSAERAAETLEKAGDVEITRWSQPVPGRGARRLGSAYLERARRHGRSAILCRTRSLLYRP